MALVCKMAGHKWKQYKCERCGCITSDTTVLIDTVKNGNYWDAVECAEILCKANEKMAIDVIIDKMWDHRLTVPLSTMHDEKVIRPLFTILGEYIIKGSYKHVTVGDDRFNPCYAKEILSNLYQNFGSRVLAPLYAMSQGYFLNKDGLFVYEYICPNPNIPDERRNISRPEHFLLMAKRVIAKVPLPEIKKSLTVQRSGAIMRSICMHVKQIIFRSFYMKQKSISWRKRDGAVWKQK